MHPLRLVQSWLGRRGFYISLQPPYALSWQLRSLFQSLHINCVLDVGAHHGEYGSFVRKALGFSGRLISFEPVPASFAVLSAVAAHDPEWLTLPYALGAAATFGTMHLFEAGVFNSLLPPTGFVAERFGQGGQETGEVQVEIRTLDDYVEQAADGIAEPRIYLKMDTQGYDQHVLAGASRMLEHVVALQSEIAVTHLYKDVPDFEEAVHHLRELGFAPIGFFPVAHASDDISVLEFDCVAVRSG